MEADTASSSKRKGKAPQRGTGSKPRSRGESAAQKGDRTFKRDGAARGDGRGRGRGRGGGRGGRGRPDGRRGNDEGARAGEDSTPGVSKLKAAIRQTKRLLAKDTIDPGLRQQSERRLRSLEQDLARKEASRTQGKTAARYHKIKFFERRKLTRRIKQLKKAIAQEPGEDEETLAALREARIKLNYVLHFPAELKYVALFASSEQDDASGKATSSDAKPAEDVAARDKARARAAEVRANIEAAMERGELSAEPEVMLEESSEISAQDRAQKRKAFAETDTTRNKRQKGAAGGESSAESEDEGESDENEGEMSDAGGGVANDDFFAQASDDSEDDAEEGDGEK